MIGLIGLGAGLLSAYQGAKQQGKANQLTQQGLDMARQQYAERAPFRQMAGQMLGSVEGDSGLPQNFGVNQGNPYSRGSRVSTAMPMAAPQQAPQQNDQLGALMQMRSQLANLPGFRGNTSKLDAEIARLTPLGGGR